LFEFERGLKARGYVLDCIYPFEQQALSAVATLLRPSAAGSPRLCRIS